MGHNSIIPRRLSEDHKNDPPGTSMRSVFFFCRIVLFVLVLFPSSPALADDTARKLLALIDYIGTDYKNAVQAGKIVNPDEYQEQLEFSKRSLELFAQNCSQCHGEAGKGDGPGRQSMNPKQPVPANFTDAEFMSGLSPFKAFNAISFGVENTAIASFAALSEDQRWQLAFYVLSLRFLQDQAKSGEALLQKKNLPGELTDVATLSTLTDDQLSEKVKGYVTEDSQASDVLAYLRRGIPDKTLTDPLVVARTRLREASELYAKGEKENAY